MTTSPLDRKNLLWIVGAFIVGVAVMAAIGALLVNIQQRKDEGLVSPAQIVPIAADELDPAVWGRNFPTQYDAFMRTQDSTIETPYGGSIPYSKLERFPAMVRLWAGFAFSKDHNEDRGHFYTTIDQVNTQRVQLVKQPAACINCHAAEAPQLIAELGWDTFNKTPFNDLKDDLHIGSSCADCHDPQTMALRLTRPALINALTEQGVDVNNLSRQQMRTYVCAQCHVEYYFLGDNKTLTFPWSQGLTADDIETHYDMYGFKDWVHAETGAPMLKMQHPEYELWSTSVHAQSGVTCADCHMPYVREGSVKVSDHWIRSPLVNINNACQTCHQQDEATLRARILTAQNRTAELLRLSEEALLDAMDAIVAAQTAGATDEQLAEARQLHRRASMRWDFISSENSTGFHSPQESARVLAMAIDFARQAQLAAEQARLAALDGSATTAATTGQQP